MDIVNISLEDCYNEAVHLYHALQDSPIASTSEEYQELAKRTVASLLDLSKIVRSSDLISGNEIESDVSTTTLRYLTVDAYLAICVDRLADGDRCDKLAASRVGVTLEWPRLMYLELLVCISSKARPIGLP